MSSGYILILRLIGGRITFKPTQVDGRIHFFKVVELWSGFWLALCWRLPSTGRGYHKFLEVVFSSLATNFSNMVIYFFKPAGSVSRDSL